MGRVTKRPIRQGSYKHDMGGWAGWIEDKEMSWIMFYRTDGTGLFYPKRDKNGGVVGAGIPCARVSPLQAKETKRKATPKKKEKATA